MAFVRNPRVMFKIDTDHIPTNIKLIKHMIGKTVVAMSIPKLGTWKTSVDPDNKSNTILTRIAREGSSRDALEIKLNNHGIEYTTEACYGPLSSR